MLNPDEPSTDGMEGLAGLLNVEVTAMVQHVAPCTPDCATCYPEGPA